MNAMLLPDPFLLVVIVVVAVAGMFGMLLFQKAPRRVKDGREDDRPQVDIAPRASSRVITVKLDEPGQLLLDRLVTAVEGVNEACRAMESNRRDAPIEVRGGRSEDIPPAPSLEIVEGHLNQIRTALSEGFKSITETIREAPNAVRGEDREPRKESDQIGPELDHAGRPPPSSREQQVIRKVNDWIEKAGPPDLGALQEVAGRPLHAVEYADGMIRITAVASEQPNSNFLAWNEPDGSMRIIIGAPIVNDYKYKVETTPVLAPPLDDVFRKVTPAYGSKLVSCGYATLAADPDHGQYILKDKGVLAPL